MSSNDKEELEDAYVNLSQQSASLIHHVATPIAIARANVEFLSKYLDVLLKHYQNTLPGTSPIPPEHIAAIKGANQLINEQLDIIQSSVKAHWQSVNKEVSGKVPDYQISASGNIETLNRLTNKDPDTCILLVEDEEIHRDIAVKLLSPHFHVDCVGTGEDAIAHCKNKRYDLILMDMYLPGINGIEASKKIIGEQGNRSIIIGLTNMPLGNQEELSDLNAYLTKPLNLDVLNECLLKIYKLSSK